MKDFLGRRLLGHRINIRIRGVLKTITENFTGIYSLTNQLEEGEVLKSSFSQNHFHGYMVYVVA